LDVEGVVGCLEWVWGAAPVCFEGRRVTFCFYLREGEEGEGIIIHSSQRSQSPQKEKKNQILTPPEMHKQPISQQTLSILSIHPHPESLVQPCPSTPPPPPPELELELEVEKEPMTQFHFPHMPLMLLPIATPVLDAGAGVGCEEEGLVGLEGTGVGVVEVGVSSLGGGVSSSTANVTSRIGIWICER